MLVPMTTAERKAIIDAAASEGWTFRPGPTGDGGTFAYTFFRGQTTLDVYFDVEGDLDQAWTGSSRMTDPTGQKIINFLKENA